MQIYVKNTAIGLIPLYNFDFEEKSHLKIDEIYRVEIKKARNYQFHKKYFALIKCAWEFLREDQINFFKNEIELFRKTVEMAAGYCDIVYSVKRKEWVEIPLSISFSKLDEFQFRELYERVKDVIFIVFLKHITEEQFIENLIDF